MNLKIISKHKGEKYKDFVMQVGNFKITHGYNYIRVSEMPNELTEHTYRSGSVEYSFITYLLSPSITEDGITREKTPEEIEQNVDNLGYLITLVHSTQLLFINKEMLSGYNKLLNKLINKQKLKPDTDNDAIKEERELY